MPFNPYFYGVYNIASINSKGTGALPYIIKSLKPQQQMEAQPAFFMQGSVLTKVLDIQHVKETINLNAPILLCTNSDAQNNLKDGLALLNDLVTYKYGSSTNITQGAGFSSLPILTHASINVSVDQASIDMTLLSDGDPNNTANVYNIKKGTTNLLNAVGIGTYAARVAKNWDFYVNLAGINLYVNNLTVTIDVETKEKNFLGSVNGWNYSGVPSDGLNNGQWPSQTDASYSGWQFPFILAGGVKIEASGKASVSIDNNNNTVNFNFLSNTVSSRTALLSASNLTLQDTGMLTMTSGSFSVWMAVPAYGVGNTVNVLPAAFTVNNAVITMKEADFSSEDMTVDFKVLAFIGS